MPKTSPEDPPEPKEAKEPKSKADTLAPRRYVEKTALTLMRWSPMGGSLWVFGHAVRTQDWLMALILFPVTLISVLWSRYTEKFIEIMGDAAQKRGISDAEGMLKRMDAANEALRWKFSGFDQTYLECQSSQCREQITEGFSPSGLFVANLEDVFVPLEISGNFYYGEDGRSLPMPPGLSRRELEQIESSEIERVVERNIWQLLADSSRQPALKQMAILAYGGYGKTTLLRHITYTYAKGKQENYNAPDLIPVLLYLREWRDAIAAEKQPILPDLITEYCQKLLEGKDIPIPPDWAKNLLKQGKMLVMFDGFDEVAQKQRSLVSQWITNQMRRYEKSVFILTSRPGGYDHYSSDKPKTKLRVSPFTSEQRQEFVTKWYVAQERLIRGGQNEEQARQVANKRSKNLIGQIEQQPELADMAKNPLLLNMIAFYHRSRSGQELPPYRAGLYRDICKVQLGDRPIFKAIELPLDVSESQQVLQGLALWMMEQNLERVEKEQLIQVLQPILKTVDDSVEAGEFVEAISEVSELLVEAEKDEYEFAHLTFQAFLAAAEIQRLKREDFLVEQWQSDWWKDTTLFYAGLVRNPSNLLQKLIAKGAVNLAYECRKNTSKKINPEIEKQLKSLDKTISNLRYQKLEEYLKNGQWKEADKETFLVMLEVMGKEKDDYFTQEELLNFPCADLLKIDRLWLEHSKINGVSKFGFSLQKEIIKKCGYKLDGSDPPSEVWYDFCDEVGWRDKKTKQWRQDYIYTLDINTNGALPFWGLVRVGEYGWVRMVDCGCGREILSRIETCEP